MQLLTDKTIENEKVKKVISLIKKCFMEFPKEKSFSFSKLTKYDDFKNDIYNFIVSIMNDFLESSGFNNDKCVVDFKKLSNLKKGFYFGSEENHLLVINEEVIRNIYDGDIEEFMAILHELNHFKVQCDIKSGKINEDIVRIIKEKLIRKSARDPFGEIDSIKSKKTGYEYVNDDYYCDNYDVYSEEIYVNLQAKKDLLFIIKSLTKDTSIQQKITKVFEDGYKDEIERYNNHERDFTNSLIFNSFYLSYEEAFDLLVTDNPDWLSYSQLNIEYYIGENNKIQKRSIEQLLELMNSTNNFEKKAYINSLIYNYRNNKNSNNSKNI